MGRVMKDSGIAWIGEIPQEWEVSTIKRSFKVVNGSTPKSDNKNYWDGDIVWITPAEMAENIVEIFESRRTITEEGLQSCGTTLVPPKSIIVSNRAPIGQVCIAGVKLCTNQGCKSLVNRINNYEKYYYYYLITQTNTLNMLGRGTTFLELSTYDLANLKIPIPSITEQQSITNYLDHKCTIIDDTIKKEETIIDKLKFYKQSIITETVTKGLNPTAKMKSSGIEWVGYIPQNWKVKPLKTIAKINGRIGFKGYTVNDLVDEAEQNRAVVLGGTNINKDGKIDYSKLTYLSSFKYLESPEIMLYGGEILITKVGAGTGENALYEGIDDLVTINPNVMIVRVENSNSKFINYQLLSNFIKKDIYIESNKSGAQPAINQEYVKSLKFIVPPFEEQKAIVEYLDTKCSAIDNLINGKQKLINKLIDYKKSLIYECVTGKKEVI